LWLRPRDDNVILRGFFIYPACPSVSAQGGEGGSRIEWIVPSRKKENRFAILQSGFVR